MEIARKSRSFTININENNTINNNSSVPLKVLKIGQLKYLIWHQKKVTLQLDDYDLMKLWMIDISEFKSDTIEEQIKKEVVEELDPFNYLSNYFSDQAAANKSIIIVQVPAITGVKYRLGKLYPFEEFRTAITPVIADAVLNIPVEENKTDGGLSYVDLSSKGILNLESAHNNDLFYVRMPYLWLWILISYNESFEFWEVMIDQKSHVLWQDSEDFNMRFWLYAFDFFQYWIKCENSRSLPWCTFP
ncbi:hypothetical protein RhiirB3_476877 [Rhizophagus irregularis]|nr:hypothetical protein RhiirB3_476877 [Rhizophagus irregularis]